MKRIALLLVVALVAISLAGCDWGTGPKDAVVTAPMDDKAPVTESSSASIKINEADSDVATSEASIEIVGEGAPSAEEMMKETETSEASIEIIGNGAPESDTSEASIEINGVEPGMEPEAPAADSESAPQ